MAEMVRVSFCATNLNTADRLSASLDSVFALGASLTVPFEVVVADGPSDDGARALLDERSKVDPRLRVVPHDQRNRGFGRRRAFEASRGTTVVPFDTSLVYAPFYADVLRGYLDLSGDRMLFSEICALTRSSIEAVGGWRDLVGGEDIDLYARVIARFGVVAYPTARRGSQSRRLSAFDRQMRYVRGSRVARARRMYAVQRDQIIGAHYRVRDLMGFNRSKPWKRRLVLRGFFTVAALGARLRPLRPIALGPNNYLLFREAILESIVRGDWRGLGLSGPLPQLLLTHDEIDYLERASAQWSRYARAQPPIVGVK